MDPELNLEKGAQEGCACVNNMDCVHLDFQYPVSGLIPILVKIQGMVFMCTWKNLYIHIRV